MTASIRYVAFSNSFIIANRNELVNWSRRMGRLDPRFLNSWQPAEVYTDLYRGTTVIGIKCRIWRSSPKTAGERTPWPGVDVLQKRMLSSGTVNEAAGPETSDTENIVRSNIAVENHQSLQVMSRIREIERILKDPDIDFGDSQPAKIWCEALSLCTEHDSLSRILIDMRFSVFSYYLRRVDQQSSAQEQWMSGFYIISMLRQLPVGQKCLSDFNANASALILMGNLNGLDKMMLDAYTILDRDNLLSLLRRTLTDILQIDGATEFRIRKERQEVMLASAERESEATEPKATKAKKTETAEVATDAGTKEEITETTPEKSVPSSHISKTTLAYAFKLAMENLIRVHGHLLFIDRRKYKEERFVLRLITAGCYISETTLPQLLVPVVESHAYFGSQMASTLLSIVLEATKIQPDMSLAADLWQLKESHQILTERDLLIWMQTQVRLGHPDEALDRYNQYPNLQADWQFDIVLKCFALLKDWNGLQQCFESLFGRGELPNLKHYAIVMKAIAPLGTTSIIDDLFQSLVLRGFMPDISIFHAVMYTRLVFGDMDGVMEYFNKLQDFGLEPTKSTYTILLQAQRDAKDLSAAIDILEDMINAGMTVDARDITLVLSLCARRRDKVTAYQIWKWAKKMEVEPDLIMNNTLLSCLVECNCLESAWQMYERLKQRGMRPGIDTLCILLNGYTRLMKDFSAKTEMFRVLYRDMLHYELKPDSHWFSAVLYHLCSVHMLEEAEMVFKEMVHMGIKRNVYHYTILLEGHSSAKNHDRVVELYREMEEKKITPTFKTHAAYLHSRQYSGREEIMGGPNHEEVNFVQDFVSSRSLVDLTSRQLPRNTLPIKIVRQLVRGFIKSEQYELAKLILEQYDEIHGHNNFRFQYWALQVELAHKSADWGRVEGLWSSFLTNLKEGFVPHQILGRDRLVLPKRYSKDYIAVVAGRIEQLKVQGRIRELVMLPKELEKLGLELGSLNLNALSRALLSFDSTIFLGCQLSERRLMRGFIHRRYRRKLKRTDPEAASKVSMARYPNTMSQKTIRVFLGRWDKMLDRVAETKKVSLQEAEKLLMKRYPRLMRGMNIWRKKLLQMHSKRILYRRVLARKRVDADRQERIDQLLLGMEKKKSQRGGGDVTGSQPVESRTLTVGENRS